MTGKDSDMGMKFYLATEGCEHSPYHCTFHYPVTSFYFDLFTLIIQTPTSTPVALRGSPTLVDPQVSSVHPNACNRK